MTLSLENCAHQHTIQDDRGIVKCMYCEGNFTYENGNWIPWHEPMKKEKTKKKFRRDRDNDDDY